MKKKARKKSGELKPCPFCGKMPKINTEQWRHFEHLLEPVEVVEQRVQIYCERCFLKMDVVAARYVRRGLTEVAYRYISKQIVETVLESAWNRRCAD